MQRVNIGVVSGADFCLPSMPEKSSFCIQINDCILGETKKVGYFQCVARQGGLVVDVMSSRKRLRQDARAAKKARRHTSSVAWSARSTMPMGRPEPPPQRKAGRGKAKRQPQQQQQQRQRQRQRQRRAEVAATATATVPTHAGHLGRFVLLNPSGVRDAECDSAASDAAAAAADAAAPELSRQQREALWASLGLGMGDGDAASLVEDESFGGVSAHPDEDAAVAATQYTTLHGHIARSSAGVDDDGSDDGSDSDSDSSDSGEEEEEEAAEGEGEESDGGSSSSGEEESDSGEESRGGAERRRRSNSWTTTDSMMAGGARSRGGRRDRSDSLVETVWDDPLIQEEEQQIACVCSIVWGGSSSHCKKRIHFLPTTDPTHPLFPTFALFLFLFPSLSLSRAATLSASWGCTAAKGARGAARGTKTGSASPASGRATASAMTLATSSWTLAAWRSG